MSNLRSVNLNLLPILRELLRKRNVTRAAEALKMSQPAVSESLAQLRHLLHNDLLISEGRSYRQTPAAARLEIKLERALALIEELLVPAEFDPRTAEGSVRIATNDYVMFVFGIALVKRMSVATRVNVHFEEATTDSLDRLRQGLLDFVMLPATSPHVSLSEFEHRYLFEDDVICIAPPGLTASETEISRAELETLPHIAFASSRSTGTGFIDSMLVSEAIHPQTPNRVPNLFLFPSFVEQTGTVALLFRRLATALQASNNIRLLKLPFHTPKVKIVAVWDKSSKSDQLHSWVCAQIEAVSEQTQPSWPVPKTAERDTSEEEG